MPFTLLYKAFEPEHEGKIFLKRWKKGEPKPLHHHATISPVIWFQASWEDLNYIKQKFSNLPMVKNGSHCTWREPFAQFIYDNL